MQSLVVRGAAVWNNLPMEIRGPVALITFKKSLKTVLFLNAYIYINMVVIQEKMCHDILEVTILVQCCFNSIILLLFALCDICFNMFILYFNVKHIETNVIIALKNE